MTQGEPFDQTGAFGLLYTFVVNMMYRTAEPGEETEVSLSEIAEELDRLPGKAPDEQAAKREERPDLFTIGEAVIMCLRKGEDEGLFTKREQDEKEPLYALSAKGVKDARENDFRFTSTS